MSDNKTHNQQRDYFSQYMQQQLRGHQLPPDEDCWSEIEHRLRRRQASLLLSRGLYMAGAAAAIALLMLVGIPANEDIPSYPAEAIEVLAINTQKTEKPIEPSVTAVEKTKPAVTKLIAQSKPEPTPEPEAKPEAKPAPEPTPEPETETKKSSELPTLHNTQIARSHKPKQKRSWQVGAGLMAMGSNLLQNGEQPKYSDNISSDHTHGGGIPIPSVPDYGNAVLQPDDYDDISYNLPLSFGITARKKLGKRIAMETGLVYTYLSTNFQRNGSTRIKGKLGLHYLGIPANLIVDLWDNSKWNIYASAGVMVEKGLRSVYTQHIYRASSEEEATVKTSIHGLQWSLNGSLGVSYRLLNDWSLYAEPRLSYFFDSNQPISIRTDKPLTVGFGLGVRFDF